MQKVSQMSKSKAMQPEINPIITKYLMRIIINSPTINIQGSPTSSIQ